MCELLQLDGSYLYQHAVLPALFPTGIEVLLKHRLFPWDSLQFQGVDLGELIPWLAQLSLFAVQGLKHTTSAVNPLYNKHSLLNYRLC